MFLTIIMTIGCTIHGNRLSDDYKNAAKGYGANKFRSIHKNPKVGDYVIFDDGNLTKREIIITKIENDKIYIKDSIRIEDRKIPESLRFIIKSKYYTETVSDLQGTVLNTFLVNEENGQVEEFILENYPTIIEKDDSDYLIKTKIGDIKCKLRYDILNGNTNYYSVIFYNEQISFHAVKLLILQKDDFQKFKLLPRNEKINYVSDVYLVIIEQGNYLQNDKSVNSNK
jgi:hypothetical protein